MNSKNTAQSVLSEIQVFERKIRAQSTAADLSYHLVNDFPKFLKAEQGFSFRAKPNGSKQILNAGSVAEVNRDSAAVQSLEGALKGVNMSTPEPLKLDLVPALSAMPYAITLPFVRRFSKGFPEAVVLVSSQPWSKPLAEQAAYLAEVYGHAFQSFASVRQRRFARFRRLFAATCLLAALAILAFVPLPITVVAPARVVSSVSVPAAPSLDGIVETVHVTAGQMVGKGQPLYMLRDRAARAARDEANARVLVAQVRETKLRAEGLRSADARQELKLAQAETELALIERKRTDDILSRHIIVAPIAGMVTGDTLSSLEGAPLAFGDAPLKIVDPKKVQLRADVSIADTSVVYDLKKARVYYNDTPTKPQPIELSALPFEPKPDLRGGVSYALMFDLERGAQVPALGAEGAVQLSGPEKPMGYVLFRRPLQWLFARVPW